jgi:molecular chaperone DnaK (HSP70)
MIGGSSLIPWVKTTIETFMGKRSLQGVSPLESVIKGAIIMAAKVKDGRDIPEIRDLALHDICPLSLGTDMTGDRMSVIIQAGSPLPAIGSRIFRTAVRNQTALTVDIFEGPYLTTTRNRLIASFDIRGIPPADAEEAQIEVMFRLDLNRILTATAVVVSQGTTAGLTVTKRGHLNEMGQAQFTESERQREKEIDEREHDEVGRKVALQHLARNLETFFDEEPSKNPRFDEMVSEQMRRELLEFVRARVPGSDGFVPSREAVSAVFERVQGTLRGYFAIHRNGIPSWLNW